MKKTALILFVLAVTVPAMGAVNITLTQVGDTNQVVIGYNCDASEEVRAFALNIGVSDSAFVEGSAESTGDPNTADYYVWPGSITFTVIDGNTVIDSFGTPVAEQSVDGGVLEMASLYSDKDPNHPVKPVDSGTLASFYVDCSGGNVTVTLSENGKRGNIVLKDPDEIPTVNLPAPLEVICGPAVPACWLCSGQPFGDATGDGKCNVFDLVALRKAWGTNTDTSPHGTAQGEYNCCADHTQDGKVNVFDLVKIRQNWGRTDLGTCDDLSCP